MLPGIEAAAEFLAGFAAAESCFTHNGPRRFRFSVGLGARDAASCELFAALMGVGTVRTYPRRKPHHDDQVQFFVESTRELVEVVVPFMDAHLPPSHKREQYLEWRSRLLDHWQHRARRRAVCRADDCRKPAKAHGWCRHHLWVHRRE